MQEPGFRIQETKMDNRQALDPNLSVVVEACAGSGKTWLLVSRVVRLLLAGIPPGEILAITFTRRAAQEMQARLRDWLYELASRDDEYVREFLRQREIEEADIERMLPRARRLYQQFLLAQPGITISTFHGWFMQILQRAPLNSGTAGGVQLVEQTAELWQEAWQTYLAGLHGKQEGEVARSMMDLFSELGLANTQNLLRNFANKRSEWWAYTAGQADPLSYAMENLRDEFNVDLDSDPREALFCRAHFAGDVFALSQLLNAARRREKKLRVCLHRWRVRKPLHNASIRCGRSCSRRRTSRAQSRRTRDRMTCSWGRRSNWCAHNC
jgi:ATP-dependent helicase/nuclease subunit A